MTKLCNAARSSCQGAIPGFWNILSYLPFAAATTNPEEPKSATVAAYYIALISNVIIMFLGFLLMIFAISCRSEYHQDFTLYDLDKILIIGIASGCFVILGGFIGTFAFSKPRSLMILQITYMVILSIVLFVTGVHFILDTQRNVLNSRINTELANVYHLIDTNIRDSIQEDFSCCGLLSWRDLRSNYTNATNTSTMPLSCCKPIALRKIRRTTVEFPCEEKRAWKTGCLPKVKTYFMICLEETLTYITILALPVFNVALVSCGVAHYFICPVE